MAEQLLNGADIVPVLEHVGRERVAKGVGSGPLRDGGVAEGVLDDALEHRLMEVVTPPLAGGTVGV
jgi:hypothetical protein